MPLPSRFMRRLRLLLRRDAVERTMDAEMRHHIDCETAERIAAGMAPEAARRSALVDFGAVERFKEEARDARGTRSLEDLWLDARYATRVLRRNPGFTAAISLTFALGIGATTSIFSVVYGVLLRPLPYVEPDRLVALWERNVPRNRDRNVVSADNFLAWRDRATAFSGMAALVPTSVTMQGSHLPERVVGAEVSAGYFSLLGVAPALGRDFVAEETDVVILSHGFWRRRFGGDPGVVGGSLLMSGTSYTIVGVMPAGFDPPRFGWLGTQDLWFPFIVTEQTRAWGRFLLVVGRLKPGVTAEAARAELVSIAGQLEHESPSNRGWSASLFGLRSEITGDARTPLLAVLAAVALLLALAITNVATLILSLMRRRGHELAIRRAIGATDARLFRQLFTQSALLGLLGTAIGLLTAIPGIRLLLRLLPPDVPRAASIALDAPVLLTTTSAAVLATILFGSITASRGRSSNAGRPDGVSSVRVAARTGGGVLVAAEIALGLALGVMALLTARSFAELRAVDLGFEADGVMAARVSLSDGYDTPERRRAFFDALLERILALPGVVSAGVISTRPLGGLGPATSVYDLSQPVPAPGEAPIADARFADAGFFATMRIHLVEGSGLANDPGSAAQPLVVVNEALARSLWPGQSAVGHRLHIGLSGGITAEISGVVRDVHLMDSRTAPRSTAYLSTSSFPGGTRDVMVRVDGDPAAIIPAVRSAVASLDPALPLYQVQTMPRILETALASDRFATFLLTAFAVVALLLAGVGVSGVFLSDVASRRREIGIRIALGGSNLAIVLLFLRRAMMQAAIGVAIGSLLGLLLARSMRSLLFGVSPGDPATFLAGAGVVVLVTVLATVLPACQALRRSPLNALREG